jgi:DNA-binding NarL/FixJ family response regulator
MMASTSPRSARSPLRLPPPLHDPRSDLPPPEEGCDLSPRELEIARLVAKGYPNKTIAAVLDISPWTVGTYLRRTYAKLGVRCRAAMVARMLTRGD